MKAERPTSLETEGRLVRVAFIYCGSGSSGEGDWHKISDEKMLLAYCEAANRVWGGLMHHWLEYRGPDDQN